MSKYQGSCDLQVAYGSDGSPSKALLGFCKKNGVQADSVVTEADAKGTEYMWAVVQQPGRAAAQVCLVHEHPIALLCVPPGLCEGPGVVCIPSLDHASAMSTLPVVSVAVNEVMQLLGLLL